LRPGALTLGERGITGHVYLVEDLGETRLGDLQVDGHLIKMRTPLRVELKEGEAVKLACDESALRLFERESGLRRETR